MRCVCREIRFWGAKERSITWMNRKILSLSSVNEACMWFLFVHELSPALKNSHLVASRPYFHNFNYCKNLRLILRRQPRIMIKGLAGKIWVVTSFDFKNSGTCSIIEYLCTLDSAWQILWMINLINTMFRNSKLPVTRRAALAEPLPCVALVPVSNAQDHYRNGNGNILQMVVPQGNYYP